jgi:hypothetical protein
MRSRFTTQADSAPPNGEERFLLFQVYKHLAPTGRRDRVQARRLGSRQYVTRLATRLFRSEIEQKIQPRERRRPSERIRAALPQAACVQSSMSARMNK